jgi:hypothetical protein
MRANIGQFFCYTCCFLLFLGSTEAGAQAPATPAIIHHSKIHHSKAHFAEWKSIAARADSLQRSDTLNTILSDSLLPDVLARKRQRYGERIAKPVVAGLDRINKNPFPNSRTGAPLGEGWAKANAYVARIGALTTQVDSLRRSGRVAPDSLFFDYGDRLEKELSDRLKLDDLPRNGSDTYPDLIRNELPVNGLPTGAQPAIDLRKRQNEYFPDPAALQSAIEDLQALKDKYRVLADSRHQKEAQNRKSLKDRPLLQRVEAGAGMQTLAYKPFSGEISITAGYLFNTVWRAGAGIVFQTGELARAAPAGYRAYTLYRLAGNLQVHAAGEYRNRPVEGAARQSGNYLAMTGVSYDVPLYRSLRLRSTALYYLTRKAALRSGFASPWQTGVGLVFYY